jgi:hypothetical protein
LSVPSVVLPTPELLVDAERVFQGEDRLQAIAQRFFATEAEARTAQQAGLDAAEGRWCR